MPESKHNMTSIVHPINLLVSDEYDRAAKIHGNVFASAHEGYGVIAEELQEAATELERAQGVMYQLLKAIHQEKPQSIVDYADYIRDVAVNGSAELIQVAAMCTKLVRTVKPDEKESLQ